MQLINFEKLFDICKEFSENHKQYGFNDEFDIQITVNSDRTYFLTLDFSELSTQVHIEPDSDYSVFEWWSSPDDWIYENDRSVIITDWILENKEVFGIPANDELQNEITTALEDTEFHRGEVLPKRLK